MKFEEYLDSLRNKSVAVIGIGVSNRPLIRLLLERGIPVTACDKKSREALGPLGDELEKTLGAPSSNISVVSFIGFNGFNQLLQTRVDSEFSRFFNISSQVACN